MRLLGKIASSVFVGIVALLALNGYLSVRREIDLFDQDMAHDGILIGQTLSPVMSEAWNAGGDDAVWSMIREANAEEHEIEIRWIRLDGSSRMSNQPRVAISMLDTLTSDNEISLKVTGGPNGGYRYTYVGVPVSDGRAALELAEPLSALHAYTSSTIARTALLAVTMGILSWLILWVLGVRFLGRPLEQLAEKARRVGVGDFSGDVVLEGRDELAHLAAAMNEMCLRLELASIAIRKQTEARMEALEHLRHSERLSVLGRISSGIAHELGTPLNVVAGRANLIATEDLSHEDVVAFSKTIVDQAHRMTSIVRQFLGFARRRASHREDTDIALLAGGISDLLAPMAEKAGVDLVLDSDDNIPEVNVDKSLIEQVLMNLIMNGIQAMPHGGKLSIGIGVERCGHRGVDDGPERDYVTIRVEDEGVGISEDKVKTIFAPFFTTKESGMGTGLGLSIVDGIVEEHDGWIDVASKPGEGSCFVIYLPQETQS